MIIWLTGLSGAGKTTIAEAISQHVKSYLHALVLIDGDVIRDLFGSSLGFNEEARILQIGRIQRLTIFLARQNIPVIVSALYSNVELLKWNRDNMPDYFEVYVDAPLHVVEARDTKGLYSKARAGDIRYVVGIDIPWHIPENPDMIVNTSAESIQQSAMKIIRAVPKLSKSLHEIK